MDIVQISREYHELLVYFGYALAKTNIFYLVQVKKKNPALFNLTKIHRMDVLCDSVGSMFKYVTLLRVALCQDYSIVVPKTNSSRKAPQDTITITFGDVAESHVGMQHIGKKASSGISCTQLKVIQTKFETLGCKTVLVDLDKLLLPAKPESSACILVVRNALNAMGVSSDELYKKLSDLTWDKKYWDARFKVVKNKLARHNVNFSKHGQLADFKQGKGTTVAWNTVPSLQKVATHLQQIIEYKELKGEGNRYYKPGTGIGYHGDTERCIVIGTRFGKPMNLHYQWYKNSSPQGLNGKLIINQGDLYIMSEKAVGTDWKKRKVYTLRHAAGASKYTMVKKKNSKTHVDTIRVGTHVYNAELGISVAPFTVERKEKKKR